MSRVHVGRADCHPTGVAAPVDEEGEVDALGAGGAKIEAVDAAVGVKIEVDVASPGTNAVAPLEARRMHFADRALGRPNSPAEAMQLAMGRRSQVPRGGVVMPDPNGFRMARSKPARRAARDAMRMLDRPLGGLGRREERGLGGRGRGRRRRGGGGRR